MSNKNFTRIIYSVFFLSGCSALIFETVWFRITATVLGSSVWSAAAVLTAFMAGLAIGNGIIAFHGQKIKNLLSFYLSIEIIIGLSGFSITFFLPKLSPHISSLLASFTETGGALNGTRFIIACSFLMIPAIAMGTTLPVMQKLLYKYDQSFMRTIAKLNGWYTIGAVFGVLLAEFVLITLMGLVGTAAIALTINLLVVFLLLKNFDTKEIFSGAEQTSHPPSSFFHVIRGLPFLQASFSWPWK